MGWFPFSTSVSGYWKPLDDFVPGDRRLANRSDFWVDLKSDNVENIYSSSRSEWFRDRLSHHGRFQAPGLEARNL